ncbi:MAG: hypothetical protein A3H96_20720 [Acidobacteria bacterium RIFCSPLOWO2_02_FULL_67_36]|nr:MAG: hypothetical protein A3H96_20720 [Acidobacteria bacterium RIFCSPLOWO2_02_FULL_67_36]OFW25480.1 MAG: hypothetical protein A3G21_19535 [Acidobacteria bacterium RIFCSPLOWO2_12_FULL_66_21]
MGTPFQSALSIRAVERAKMMARIGRSAVRDPEQQATVALGTSRLPPLTPQPRIDVVVSI